MRKRILEIAERLVAAVERIAGALEARDHGERPKLRKHGLRKPRSTHVVPNDMDRARAKRALKGLGYSNDDKT